MRLEVKTLSTLMKENGHKHIDILKAPAIIMPKRAPERLFGALFEVINQFETCVDLELLGGYRGFRA